MTNSQSKMVGKSAGDIAPLGAEEDVSSWPSEAARAAVWGVGPEQVEEVEAVVKGSIPDWVTGTLVYNGGGDYSKVRHMFDGYGFLSRLRVKGGRAWGNQRYVQSKAYKAYKAQGRVVLNEFATPPQGLTGYAQQMLAPFGALLSRRFPLTPMTDNACVSIHAIGPAAAHSNSNGATCPTSISTDSSSSSGGKGVDIAAQVELMAITEDPWGSYIVDPETLDTLEQVVYPDKVPAIMQSPHPAVLSDGSIVNFSRVFPFGGSHLYRQDRVTLERKQIAYVPDRHWLTPSWMHDFACTDKYAVLIEQPLYMDFLAMFLGWDNDAVWMRWRPEEGTRLHLITLDGSKPVRTFTTPGFPFVHVGNAFESENGTTLNVDLGVFDSAHILNDLKMSVLRQGPSEGHNVTECQYMRLSLPLSEADPDSADSSSFLPGPMPLIPAAGSKHVDFVDFPTINPDYKGMPYKYVYMACAVRPTNVGNGLAKMDVQTGEVKTWHEPGAVTGEPQFIPKPGATAEDDGVVVSPCVGADGKAFVLFMDAASWQELARAQLPYSTPYRFHGVWLGGRA